MANASQPRNQLIRVLSAVLLIAACNAERPSAPAESKPASPPAPAVEGQAAVGAVVTLEPATGEEPLPEGPAIMDQFSKLFVSEV